MPSWCFQRRASRHLGDVRRWPVMDAHRKRAVLFRGVQQRADVIVAELACTQATDVDTDPAASQRRPTWSAGCSPEIRPMARPCASGSGAKQEARLTHRRPRTHDDQVAVVEAAQRLVQVEDARGDADQLPAVALGFHGLSHSSIERRLRGVLVAAVGGVKGHQPLDRGVHRVLLPSLRLPEARAIAKASRSRHAASRIDA